ncbi:hypothetical protein RIF29_22025 [Crotalaria pallida]|uniref:Uncharacterized protein n=1 Tax=Crotalaria pallida TaxID=3830 RepID=A0AAN9I7P7_CROPI
MSMVFSASRGDGVRLEKPPDPSGFGHEATPKLSPCQTAKMIQEKGILMERQPCHRCLPGPRLQTLLNKIREMLIMRIWREHNQWLPQLWNYLMEIGSDISRAHDGTKDVGYTLEKSTPLVDRIIKRGPDKRSRQESKHATPTHILLRNAEVKGLCKDGATHIENTTQQVVIQPGNFGASVPQLVKGTTLRGSSDVNAMHGWDKDGIEVVPETQFAIDPGQVGPNDITMQR